MTADSEIRDKIQKFILGHFIKDPNTTLNDDISLLEKGIIDSTGVMELVAFLEVNLSIRVEDEEIIPDNLDSVNKMVSYVRAKLNT
jgi:acyl carrier protein